MIGSSLILLLSLYGSIVVQKKKNSPVGSGRISTQMTEWFSSAQVLLWLYWSLLARIGVLWAVLICMGLRMYIWVVSVCVTAF